LVGATYERAVRVVSREAPGVRTLRILPDELTDMAFVSCRVFIHMDEGDRVGQTPRIG